MAIQKEVLKQGTSASEKLGATVEAIPIIGSLANKYASGMIENPRANVDTMVRDIDKMGQIATNMREKAVNGKMGDPQVAFDTLQDLEVQISKAEQRIKLLSLQSGQLRADADALNKIETSILDAKQRAFDAKQAAALGIVGQPTDSNIHLTLQDIRKGVGS